MADFFISYNRADKHWAEWIAWNLEANGYTTIIQEWDFRPGGNFVQEMQEATAQSERTIAVLSPHYLGSRFTQPEWNVAFAKDPTGKKKLLLPVRVQKCDLEGLLPQMIYIDLVELSSEEAQGALLAGVQSGRAKRAEAPAFPGSLSEQARPSKAPPAFPGDVAPMRDAVAAETKAAAPKVAPKTTSEVSPKQQITILYKRGVMPDETLMQMLNEELGARGYNVFIDRRLSIGVAWAQEIEDHIRASDAVIPLISPKSLESEILEYELQTAHQAAQIQAGKPRILPVRVGYTGALPTSLALILDALQYSLWQDKSDNAQLVEEITAALKAPASSTIDENEVTWGAVALDSKFYIARATDTEFINAVARQDSIVLVKGARQMGKTSLLARGLQKARDAGAQIVLTDFQTLTEAELNDPTRFCMALCRTFKSQLDLDVSIRSVWDEDAGPGENLAYFLRREVLKKTSAPVVWGMDEVDRLFTSAFGSEIFGLFRSWHNARALDPKGTWARLTLAIAYATEAHLFITDPNQSPFNVGTRLVLEDFTREQVAELNRRYGSPLRDAGERERFYQLVGGYPFLTRCGLSAMAQQGLSLAALEMQEEESEPFGLSLPVKEARVEEDGPWGDHLHRILVMLAKNPGLMEALRGALRGASTLSDTDFYRLRSAGIMVGATASQARPRCQLYQDYLTRHLL